MGFSTPTTNLEGSITATIQPVSRTLFDSSEELSFLHLASCLVLFPGKIFLYVRNCVLEQENRATEDMPNFMKLEPIYTLTYVHD